MSNIYCLLYMTSNGERKIAGVFPTKERAQEMIEWAAASLNIGMEPHAYSIIFEGAKKQYHVKLGNNLTGDYFVIEEMQDNTLYFNDGNKQVSIQVTQ